MYKKNKKTLFNMFRKFVVLASWSKPNSGRSVQNMAMVDGLLDGFGWSYGQNSCIVASAPS